jgi:hypothetical protein
MLWDGVTCMSDRGSRFALFAVLTALVFGIGPFLLAYTHARPGGVDAARATALPMPASGTVARIADGDGDALRQRLVGRPHGMSQVTFRDSAFGVQTLDKYIDAEFSGSVKEKALLRARKLRIIASEAWADGSTTTLIDLVQFADTAGAHGFALEQAHAFANDSHRRTTESVTGVRDGHAFQLDSTVHIGDIRTVAFGRVGPIMVMVSVEGPRPSYPSADIALLTRQAGMLAA